MARLSIQDVRLEHTRLLAELHRLVDLDVGRPAMTAQRKQEIAAMPGVGGLRMAVTKSVRSRRLRTAYEAALARMIRRFARADMNAAEFRDGAFDLTVEAYWDAFNDGREAGGVDEDVFVYSHEAGIVATQIVWAVHSINKIISLIDPPPASEAILRECLGRVPAMSAAIEELWYEGLASAAGDPMYEWIIGHTREHCRDCLAYSGQRHRLRQWIDVGAVPQTYALECHGFHCACELRPSRGREVGVLLAPGLN